VADVIAGASDAGYAAYSAIRHGADGAVIGADTAYQAYAAANGAALEDHIWEEVREDARRIVHGKDPLAARLWSIREPDWFARLWTETQAIWQADNPANWAFWTRWFQAAIDGTPLTWELQRDIALIDNADWQAGPARVAERIAEIEERHRLRREVVTLRAEVAALSDRVATAGAPASQRGHNAPPALIDPEAEVRVETGAIVAALVEAEAELAHSGPSPAVLVRVGQFLLNAIGRVGLYCAGLADVAAQEAAKKLGENGLNLLIAWYLAKSPAIQAVGQALLAYASKLLAGH